MEIKDTLLIQRTKFPMRGNLGVREIEFQKKWEEMDLYKKVLEKNKDNKPFILHDGPPYANGNIHIGHALQKTLKDFVLRYKTMSGFYVPFIPGWDTHGLPIENEVIKKGAKRDEMSVTEFRDLCKKFALEQVEKQKEQFKRLGILGEWDNPYITLNNSYIADQLLVFSKMADKDLIYRGLKPVHWSPSSESAFAEAEIEYKDKVSESIYFKFPLKNTNSDLKGANLLIWTTTPWTLPANLAVAVNPNMKYILISSNYGRLILLESLLPKLKEKLGLEKVLILKQFNGKDLENLTYKHPLYDRVSPVILGEHVTDEDGTGLVHTAPGHGEDDYLVGLKYNLDILSPVDSKGIFTKEAGKYEGQFYEKANLEIIKDLKEVDSLVFNEQITHSYPHDWRTGKPIIFRSTPQWFLSIDPLRKDLLKAVKDVNWTPKWGEVRLSNMIESRGDWVISRQRVWGVPLPIFYAENGEPILDSKIIDHVAELVREHGINIWYEWEAKDLLPKKYKNKNSPNGIFHKETDIMDVWFDSGTSYEVLKERNLPFPADLYLEGSDQYRGWFNSSLTTSIASYGKSPYKNVVSHGFVLDGQGFKMSKSVGNVVDPIKMMQQQGADLLRLWVATTAYQSDVRISDDVIKQTSEAYRKIRNTVRFLLANIGDFDPNNDYVSFSMRGNLNRAFTFKYYDVVEKVIKAYDEYDFDKVYRIIMPFIINDVSAFYLDYTKDVLYIERKDDFERRSIQSTLYDIAFGLIRLLNPIIPHTTSEAYWELPYQKYEDVYLESMPEIPSYSDEALKMKESLQNAFDIFLDMRDHVLKALEEARNEKIIGKSLESEIILNVTKEQMNAINLLQVDLELVLISSHVILTETNEFSVKVNKFDGHVCDRCWRFFKEVNEENLCERCSDIVEEFR